MKTLPPPPRPAVDLSQTLHYHLVYTLIGLAPPPLDDSPEALRARNHAAVAKAAALMPVGANEIDLAAHCIAARAQAEEMLRQVRENEDDIELVLRLNAQYGSMVRTSLAVHGRLMRVQALRHKREAIEGAANQDAWTKHIAERCMLWVADPEAGRKAAAPAAAPVAVRDEAPVSAPAARLEQGGVENVSDDGTNSHDVAFETWVSKQPWNQRGRGADKTDPRKVKRAAKAKARLAGRDGVGNGGERLGRAE